DGAGSQFDTLSLLGESCWMRRSTEPSAFVLSWLRWESVYRLSAFGTKKYVASYIVSDQNPLTGGSSPLLKCITYFFSPLYFLIASGPSEVGYTASCGRFAPRPIAVMNARWR